MSKYAHKGQILPIINQMIPIDKETTFHASYDHDLSGFNQGELIYPDGQEWVSHFNGDDTSFISHASISFSAGDSWTAEAWVQYDRIAQWAFFLGNDTSSSQAICIHPTDAMLTFRASDATYIIGPAIPNPADWNHLCVTYSNGVIRFYINGIPSAPQTKSSAMSFNNIGWAYTSVAAVKVFQGQMSEVRIWDVAKGKSEIEKMMKTRMSGNETGLVGYWKLSEREGSISFDSSNNRNDGKRGVGVSTSRGNIVATLKKEEGKFRGAVLIEPDSRNILKRTGENINIWGRDTDDVTVVSTQEESFVFPWSAKWSGSTKSGAGNCYIAGAVDIDQTIYSTAWTWSCYLKRADGKPVTSVGSMYMYANAQDDGARLNANAGPTGIVDCGNGWYRAWRTESLTESANISLVGLSSLDKTTEWYMNGWQLEPRIGLATSYILPTLSRTLGKLWYPKELVNTSLFTISCWFNIPYMHREATSSEGINTNWFHPIIEIATKISGSQSFGLVAGPEPSSWGRKLTLQSPISGTSTFPVQDDVWYHMVTTYDGVNYRVYIDGVERISVAGPPISTSEGEYLMVGGGYRGKPNILIDELRIESRAISLEEVEAWAASGLHYNYLDYSQHVD